MKNRGLIPLFSLAAAVLLLQGCAGTPKGAAAPPAKQDLSKTELNEQLDPAVAEAAKGYERVMKNGELFFCKREQPIGSKMWTTRCVTEVQLKEQVEDAKKFQSDVMQQGRRCSGAGCS
jgi:hypothetical protein